MIKLAIDLGSSVTKIYRADASNGIVLADPLRRGERHGARNQGDRQGSQKADGQNGGIYGDRISRLRRELVDMRLAAAMLKEFLARIGIKSARLKRSETLFSVPCGASEGLKADYAALAEECGLKKVRFAEAPFLAALGADSGARGSKSRLLHRHRRRRHQRGGGVSGRHYRGAFHEYRRQQHGRQHHR